MVPPDPRDPLHPDAPSQSGANPIAAGLILIGASLVALLVLAISPLGSAVLPGPMPTPTPDSFAGVRAEAQQAFERGQQHYRDSDLDRALIEFDRAKVNDPDRRADIEQALQSTVEQLRARQPVAEAEPTPQLPRPSPTPYTVVLPEPAPTRQATPPSASTPATAAARPTPSSITAKIYRDTEQRFHLDIPSNWEVTQKPEAEAGVGVVGFYAPDGKASLVVSVDVQRDSVSPELYSAHLETSMRALPGYTPETAAPTLIGGAPALRRIFTFRGSGTAEPVRTLQVVLGQRTTMFILTATAPSTQFSGTSAEFERMVSSFRMLS